MKLECWMVGKTAFSYIEDGMGIYHKRMKRYLPFEGFIIPDIKNAKNRNPEQIKSLEGEAILKKLQSDDFLILLDERGKRFTSRKLAEYLNRQLQEPHKRIIFLIGGAYGFSDAVYQRANAKLSLSDLTFSHQMIRLFLYEQIYRSFTIMKGEPYHND